MKSAHHDNRGTLKIGLLAFLLAASFALPRSAAADDKVDHKIDLAEGQMQMTAPESWIRKQPRVRIIDHEFAVPAAKGDTEDGRVTIMGAGGRSKPTSIAGSANSPRPMARKRRTKLAEADASKRCRRPGSALGRLISGTFHDRQPPSIPTARPSIAKATGCWPRSSSRRSSGNYFIKFYGPKQTVADHAEEFHKMIAGLMLKK